jgi:NitT/TauT family transport system permease protein
MARARRHKWVHDAFWMLVSVAATLAIWDVAVRVFKIPGHLVPSPEQVFGAGMKNLSSIGAHSLWTVFAVLLGFALAAIFAVSLAIVIVLSPTMERIIYPPMVAIQSIPKIALAPLFVVWFGFGVVPKVAVAFLICFFPVVVDTIVGLRNTDPALIQLARSMGAGPRKIFLKLRLPGALPSLFGGLKVASALAVVGALTGEFIGSDTGLGYLLISASGMLNTALLFAILVVLSLLATAFFYAIEVLERFLIPWHVSQRAHSH